MYVYGHTSICMSQALAKSCRLFCGKRNINNQSTICFSFDPLK